MKPNTTRVKTTLHKFETENASKQKTLYLNLPDSSRLIFYITAPPARRLSVFNGDLFDRLPALLLLLDGLHHVLDRILQTISFYTFLVRHKKVEVKTVIRNSFIIAQFLLLLSYNWVLLLWCHFGHSSFGSSGKDSNLSKALTNFVKNFSLSSVLSLRAAYKKSGGSPNEVDTSLRQITTDLF